MDNQQLELLLKDLKDLYKKEKDLSLALQQEALRKEDQYESAETNKLAEAFAKAQGEYKRVTYNRENPYFKSSYADLDTIVEAVKDPFAKYGLSFYQYTKISDEGATLLISVLKHSSGQWISSRTRIIPPKNDPQSYGSTLSYQKRYQAQCLLRVTIAHDLQDDDAEVAMIDSRDIMAKGTAVNTKYNPKEQSAEVITKEQLEELEYELSDPDYQDIAEQVLDGLRIQSLADMPKSKFMVSLKRIREIKLLRKNGPEK